jgi:hypothetical protein
MLDWKKSCGLNIAIAKTTDVELNTIQHGSPPKVIIFNYIDGKALAPKIGLEGMSYFL